MSVAVQSAPNGLMDVDVNGINAGPEEAHVARFASGLILPPPEIKSVIDRTATFVARSANPPQFEDKIREGQRNDPKFSFLNPADPYHAYYRHKLTKVAQGEIEETVKQETPNGQVKEVKQEVVDVGLEPPPPDFIMDMPNISAIDLDIMKLTALFTARRGRNFLQSLSAREARNFQFEFLRPTHSLFGYFNRLVEQYTKVLHPNKDMLEQLQLDAEPGARWRKLEIAKRHAKWEKNKREKDKRRQDDQEAERIAFAEIDWHDYAIVQTIEFTAADATSELPPPMSVQEVENMTLAQKRYAAMILENTAEDVEALRVRQAVAETEAAAAAAAASNAMQQTQQQDTIMQSVGPAETPEDRLKREQMERAREIEHAQAMQAGSGPMKIRTDYVPKFGSKSKQQLTTCSVCGQQIPIDELGEHMRIELLDPKWKEQRDMNEARHARSSELLSGANVGSSLKNLARKRVDIFGAEADEEKRKKEEEEEKVRRKEREKVVWDGHTASMARTVDAYSTNVNFEEQIAAIHRAKGLGPQEAGAIGPGIGPASIPAPLTGSSSLPPGPRAAGGASNPAYSAATITSGPQPASAYPPQQSTMLPPMQYQGGQPGQGYNYQQPGMPSMPPAQTGQVRSAEEMEGGEAEAAPPPKRQRVAKLPGGQLYPEADWIGMHPYPISLQVQLPEDETKPEWKLDGKVVTLPELPLNFLVSTLRDRILQTTGSSAPVSRIRLSYQGKMLTNSTTIASHNLEDDDMLVLSVSAPRKR
ncbi:Pre-mRNA splicing factor PRP21 like protein-domain-containing protein [Schizophyllum amplum]|uniref:Pre-mRNA splicing factor PRP21 like protein-domain-containing protein n=1 Tax=Schizophyllum amplum TaxID=97359 RepID=A0A550CAB6_9AGAR|nr:Pre-mRNA splicing factor PRP21 like protein-domain-containing protein [Auriculariopsis ampla]